MQLGALDALARAELSSVDLRRSIQSKVLRYQSTVNRRMDEIAGERAALAVALEKVLTVTITQSQP